MASKIDNLFPLVSTQDICEDLMRGTPQGGLPKNTSGVARVLRRAYLVLLCLALSGSFDVVIKDGLNEQVFSLNRSYYGLFIPAGLWRHMENFSTNSLF